MILATSWRTGHSLFLLVFLINSKHPNIEAGVGIAAQLGDEMEGKQPLDFFVYSGILG
jgi:hypothetical protein